LFVGLDKRKKGDHEGLVSCNLKPDSL